MKRIVFFLLATAISTIPLSGKPSFDYYAQKTRMFIKYFGYENPNLVGIHRIEQYEKRPGWVIRAYTDQHGIHLNEAEFEKESEGTNLFTCAHEAVHFVFHQDRSASYDIEMDADIKAAEMLCSKGYAWVVQESIAGYASLMDANKTACNLFDTKRPRPTVQARHDYLQHVLSCYLESRPFESKLLTIYKQDLFSLKSLISHVVVGAAGIFSGLYLKPLGLLVRLSKIKTKV